MRQDPSPGAGREAARRLAIANAAAGREAEAIEAELRKAGLDGHLGATELARIVADADRVRHWKSERRAPRWVSRFGLLVFVAGVAGFLAGLRFSGWAIVCGFVLWRFPDAAFRDPGLPWR